MAKLADYNITANPVESVLFKDDTRFILNFGKYQMASSTGLPNFVGNRGEFFLTTSSGIGYFSVYTSTGSITTGWVIVSSFNAIG